MPTAIIVTRKFAALLAASMMLTSVPAFATTPVPQNAADKAFAAGEFDRAEQLYRLDLRKRPNDERVLSQLGELNLFSNRSAKALSFYERALAIDPADRIAVRGLADAQERMRASASQPLSASTVTVPLIAVDPLPVVKVRLDDRRDAYFLLDTGAPGVVVDPALAAELKGNVSASGSGVFAGGKGAKVEQTTVDSIDIGTAEVRHIQAAVLPMAGAPSPVGTRIEGIIGTAFFARFVTTLDYAQRRLVLAPLSTRSAIERKVREGRASSARMWFVGDHFLFARAIVNHRLEGLFNIDTGGEGFGIQLAEHELTNARIALDLKKKSRMSAPGGEVVTVPFVATVKLGGFERPAIPGIVTLGGDQYGIFPFDVAGTLTHDFFKGHSVTFDFVAMQIILG